MQDSVEIERKYVIVKPDVAILAKQEGYTVSKITQIYVASPAHITHRVRARVYNDRTVYTETKKIRIDKISAYEDEREITEAEFLSIKESIAPDTHPVLKTRHTFYYRGRVFEIDFYPEWQHTSIMETELPSRETVVEMPDFLRIITEVSGDKRYSNASMSHTFPKELELPEGN